MKINNLTVLLSGTFFAMSFESQILKGRLQGIKFSASLFPGWFLSKYISLGQRQIRPRIRGSLVEKFRGRTLDPDCLSLSLDSAPASCLTLGKLLGQSLSLLIPSGKRSWGWGWEILMLSDLQSLY